MRNGQECGRTSSSAVGRCLVRTVTRSGGKEPTAVIAVFGGRESKGCSSEKFFMEPFTYVLLKYRSRVLSSNFRRARESRWVRIVSTLHGHHSASFAAATMTSRGIRYMLACFDSHSFQSMSYVIPVPCYVILIIQCYRISSEATRSLPSVRKPSFVARTVLRTQHTVLIHVNHREYLTS